MGIGKWGMGEKCVVLQPWRIATHCCGTLRKGKQKMKKKNIPVEIIPGCPFSLLPQIQPIHHAGGDGKLPV
jgi:hypothetical protein